MSSGADVVERARALVANKTMFAPLLAELADEIERLRADSDEWVKLVRQGVEIERELRTEIERLRADLEAAKGRARKYALQIGEMMNAYEQRKAT
jgi:uncharacterized small protein (DUF1192 family)